MKKVLYLAMLFFAVASCTTDKTEVPTEKPADVKIEKAEVKTDEKVTETPVAKEMFFEDYLNYNTRAKLEEKFGKENIKNGHKWYGEGTMRYASTTVTNPDDGNIVTYLWQEKDSNKLNFIEAYCDIYNDEYELERKQKIKSKDGVYLGMSIADLKDWNGEEVSFSGFGWDFAGGLLDRKGKLKNDGVNIRLGTSETDVKYLGDIELSTTDSEVLKADIYVNEFTLSPKSE